MNIQIGLLMPGLLGLTPESDLEVLAGFRQAYEHHVFKGTEEGQKTYRIERLWLDGHKVMARVEEIEMPKHTVDGFLVSSHNGRSIEVIVAQYGVRNAEGDILTESAAIDIFNKLKQQESIPGFHFSNVRIEGDRVKGAVYATIRGDATNV